ncbi:DNA gyrase subunit A [Dietzia sp. SLG310A2-38A2]|uniref:DNA gyrase subunit A n=1 Tax=Dietzia sp. SLG310A2-38A2 TaxID=1630643 RepID=UPI0015F7EF4E|nr:DNA gyrase subunit A [Dietzia sp. SLG310A2-38A2]MBB1031841.1 DNA gyrase subunit A [Dietzia sp. SLG310A2-38A2]
MGAVGGWFEPGDDAGRAWDEAEAVLLACEDLDAVMETIRRSESPVDARRALKLGFGFSGRQAALLLTLPVLSFTRSERDRMRDSRRARLDLFADVTGAIPAMREDGVEIEVEDEVEVDAAAQSTRPPEPVSAMRAAQDSDSDSDSAAARSGWGAEFDGALDRIRWAMDGERGQGPTGPPSVIADAAGSSDQVFRRSRSGRVDEAAVVLDEQVGELCDAIAALLQVESVPGAWLDDPRASDSRTGSLLDSCGVDDSVGIRTLLWHLRRTGLDSVEGLLPFAEPLGAAEGFDVQARRFEHAMSVGGLGSEPGSGASWTGRLWPIAERRGYGYAVTYRNGPDAGTVWAYGGDEPLHRVWDSVVDLLVELYQSLTTGEPCDAAVAAATNGRVVWTNLS